MYFALEMRNITSLKMVSLPCSAFVNTGEGCEREQKGVLEEIKGNKNTHFEFKTIKYSY